MGCVVRLLLLAVVINIGLGVEYEVIRNFGSNRTDVLNGFSIHELDSIVDMFAQMYTNDDDWEVIGREFADRLSAKYRARAMVQMTASGRDGASLGGQTLIRYTRLLVLNRFLQVTLYARPTSVEPTKCVDQSL